jgi:AraC-like DNA-binding protein
LFRPGELICVDLTKPYSYAWSEKGSAFCISVEGDTLGMPRSDVVAACSRVVSSPVRGLFANHIAGLARDVDAIPQDVAGDAVGSATGDLLKALLTSVASDARVARAGYAETQFARVRAYVEQNFHQPDLDATRIARATSMSVRHLYRICAVNAYSIEQVIMTLRLHAAQKQLAEPSSGQLTIAAVARAVGFVDPAHFTRRFTREFGLPPRDWRVLAGEGLVGRAPTNESADADPADSANGRVPRAEEPQC